MPSKRNPTRQSLDRAEQDAAELGRRMKSPPLPIVSTQPQPTPPFASDPKSSTPPLDQNRADLAYLQYTITSLKQQNADLLSTVRSLHRLITILTYDRELLRAIRNSPFDSPQRQRWVQEHRDLVPDLESHASQTGHPSRPLGVGNLQQARLNYQEGKYQ